MYAGAQRTEMNTDRRQEILRYVLSVLLLSMFLFEAVPAKAAAPSCTEVSSMMDDSIATGLVNSLPQVLERKSDGVVYHRNFYVDDGTWRRASIGGKRGLAAMLLAWIKCNSSGGGEFIKIYGKYSGKKLAKYGSRSGLRIY